MKIVFRLLLTSLVVTMAFVAIAPQYTASAQSDYVGQTLLIQGQVLDTEGNPIPGAVVEIWQADTNGHYTHPNDASPDQLDPAFQYFGTVTTDANGNYAFRTIKPAAYETRPPHIHVKVKIDGQEVLISQFYFEEDRAMLATDGVARAASDPLVLAMQDVTDANGQALRAGTANLVIDRNGAVADSLKATEAQTEGPYYPVIDFRGYDNDLTSVAVGDALVTPMPAQTESQSPVARPFTLINLNTATAEALLTIPNMSNRMVREFMEYRPYTSIVQFRREIGKYVNDAQVAEYEQYIYVPIRVDQATSETLKQIPGVDDALADALIAARPYGSNAAFLARLAESLAPEQVAYAQNFLEAE